MAVFMESVSLGRRNSTQFNLKLSFKYIFYSGDKSLSTGYWYSYSISTIRYCDVRLSHAMRVCDPVGYLSPKRRECHIFNNDAERSRPTYHDLSSPGLLQFGVKVALLCLCKYGEVPVEFMKWDSMMWFVCCYLSLCVCVCVCQYVWTLPTADIYLQLWDEVC